MSRTKRSLWEVCFCVFANVSRETLVLGGLLLRFCECLVRNARFGRFAFCDWKLFTKSRKKFTDEATCQEENTIYEETRIQNTCSQEAQQEKKMRRNEPG